ncbi:MAG: NfeD family protein [Candidatus Sedimenticola sp. 6PFRAG5]
MEWLENASYWHWWVVAVVLVILEVFSPGAFFLWLGISAGITGLIMLAVPDLSWQYQLLLFSVFSVASIMIWHLFLKHHPTESDHPVLNRRGEQYIDRVFTLDEPVVNGLGKIRVDDSTWKISGEDCDAGSRVRVVGVDGVVLKIVVVI